VHIPDGFFDLKTIVTTTALSGASLTYAVRRTKAALKNRQVPLMGVMAAFIFAAQMININVIFVPGVSGHLIGAVLAAIVLGPWNASIIMTTVLFIQWLLFQDGGITALGGNVLNMAVLAPLAGYYTYRLITGIISGPVGRRAATFIAAWLSVQVTAAAAAVELAFSGNIDIRLQTLLAGLLFYHVFIGLIEGVITAAVVAYLEKAGTVPGLEPARQGGFNVKRAAVALFTVAILAAAVMSPWASALPDGLEKVAIDKGFIDKGEGQALGPALIPDYVFPGIENQALATSVAGVLGTLAVFGLAYVFMGGARRAKETKG
jgi:cobalt/nickel transport system permease protein